MIFSIWGLMYRNFPSGSISQTMSGEVSTRARNLSSLVRSACSIATWPVMSRTIENIVGRPSSSKMLTLISRVFSVPVFGR